MKSSRGYDTRIQTILGHLVIKTQSSGISIFMTLTRKVNNISRFDFFNLVFIPVSENTYQHNSLQMSAAIKCKLHCHLGSEPSMIRA